MKLYGGVKGFYLSCWVMDLPLANGLRGLVLGDHPQIMGDHAPADPALHPRIAVVAAALQPMPPFEPADPPFDPGPPIAAAPPTTSGAHARCALVASGPASAARPV